MKFPLFYPLLAAGDKIYQQMKSAGVDGCLVVDLPVEEAAPHLTACKAAKITSILLISPSRTRKRLKKLMSIEKGCCITFADLE